MKAIFIPYVPARGLSRYVLFLWFAHGEDLPAKEKVLPNGVVEWIFNVNESPHFVLDDGDHSKRSLYRHSWIAGIQDKFLVIQSKGETKLFGIRFRPGGMVPFLRAPLFEFTNGVYELDQVMGNRVRFVNEQLAEQERFGLLAQFEVLESFLLSLLVSDDAGCSRSIDYAVRALVADPHKPIRELAGEMGVSHKHLIAQFRRAVGLPPKTLQRIQLFQQSIRLISRGQFGSLSEVAHRLGYSDQAHFNHEFKSFSGVSPRQYLETVTMDPNHIYVK